MKNFKEIVGRICIFIGSIIFALGCWASEMLVAKALSYELYFKNLEHMISSAWYLFALGTIAVIFGIVMTRLIINQINLWKLGKEES